MDAYAEHRRKRDRLAAELADARRQGTSIALRKDTSNLFRNRDQNGVFRLDVRGFDRVLSVDARNMAADVEGMTTYETFVRETLPHGVLPAVAPQLKTITVGGAVSGVGIESSSFRYGLVHETVDEMDVLLADGRLVTCSRTENSDLFFGFANSYGTLGYALRLRVRVIPAKPYVHLRHERFSETSRFFERIGEHCEERRLDYLDGVVFGPGEMYVTSGEFCDDAPQTSDYTWMRIYYRSMQQRSEDWLRAADYIWRWDTDWFWCSKQFKAQNAAVRLIAGRRFLNSRTYQRIMRVAARALPDSGSTESVIQDVDIPIGNAGDFLRFLLGEIGITPIWICPFRTLDPATAFPLYHFDPGEAHVNFGFWDVIQAGPEPGHFNRKVERKAFELGGKKGLYSTSYYDRETFWSMFNKPCYDALKRRYDPDNRFKDLYDKCVLRK
jgi:FAD/FMN-containing dehydrogenase